MSVYITATEPLASRKGSDAMAAAALGVASCGLISTPQGRRRVDGLRLGDLVVTRDHGAQPLKGVQRWTVPALGALAPVTLRKGCLGAERSTMIGAAASILVEGAMPELLLGEPEVLARVKDLLAAPGLSQDDTGFVTYVVLSTARHELVEVDGVWSQTQCHDASGYGIYDPTAEAARPILQAHEARVLAR